MKIELDKIIEKREKYEIMLAGKDLLVKAIVEKKYKYDWALLLISDLQRYRDEILEEQYIDVIVQIPSPFRETSVNFYLIHFNKNKPSKFMTGIFNESVCYRRRYYCNSKKINLQGEYTEDFLNLIENLNYFLEDKKVKREDLNICEFDEFNKEILTPWYYTKQAVSARKSLENSDYKLLSEYADVLEKQEYKDIVVKYMNSQDMKYPFEYNKLKKEKIQRALKLRKGDIVCLLIGDNPKFYLYNEEYDDVYVKLGNYCVLRTKDKKYTSYLVNYLNDEKARIYFSFMKKGVCIQYLSKNDLKNLKVIVPNDRMVSLADEVQNYLMNRKTISQSKINEIIRKSSSIKYEKENQRIIGNDIIGALASIKIEELKKIIIKDMEETELCLEVGAYKAVIILCGSILESVLLDWLSEYENTSNILNVGKNEKGRDLELKKIIDKLKEKVKPRWYEYKKANYIRRKRNMVHPKEYIKNNKVFNYDECREIIDNLKDVIESREKRRGNFIKNF